MASFPVFLLQIASSLMDLSHLEHLFKGDRVLVRQWIDLYLQESPQYFGQLADSLDKGDAEALAAAAHDLQPQAHYLNAGRMPELLVALEEEALSKGTSACSGMLEALWTVRTAIEGELREELKDA